MSKTNRRRGSPGPSLERFATTLRADFRFAPLNAFLVVAVFVVGLTVHLNVHPFSVRAVEVALGPPPLWRSS